MKREDMQTVYYKKQFDRFKLYRFSYYKMAVPLKLSFKYILIMSLTAF